MSELGIDTDLYLQAFNGCSKAPLSYHGAPPRKDRWDSCTPEFLKILSSNGFYKDQAENSDKYDISRWASSKKALKDIFRPYVNGEKPNMAVVYLLGSYHYKLDQIHYADGTTRDMNWANPGLALQIDLSDNSYYMFGAYLNSFYKISIGSIYGIETKGGPYNGLIGAGVEVGGILGYGNYVWDEPLSYMVPYAALTMRVGQSDELNLKMTLTPNIETEKYNIAGSVGFMLRQPF